METPILSFRGLFLVVTPWMLAINQEQPTFFSLAWWEIVQYLLGIAVAVFGLYDFYLKIKLRRKQINPTKEPKEDEAIDNPLQQKSNHKL